MSDNPGTPSYILRSNCRESRLMCSRHFFAYGVLAYELLANHKPFPGGTPGDILGVQLEPVGLSRRHPLVSDLVPELQSALCV